MLPFLSSKFIPNLLNYAVLFYINYQLNSDNYENIYLYGLSANPAHEPPLRSASSRSSARFL